MAQIAKATIKLRAAEITDVGMVRDHNEDSGHVDPDLSFFIVADGMGGHAAGEVASAMAVAEVSKALTRDKPRLDAFAAAPDDHNRREVVALLEQAVRAAHEAVFSRGTTETDKQGMGTTLDVLLITGAEAFVAHVGDSRTYLIRDGKAAQVTTDHTVAEVLVIEGKLSSEEALASPLRTILVNAIGVSADVGVEISHIYLRKNDRLLLCSDGLHDYFPGEDELVAHLVEGDLHTGLQELVDIAKDRGGHDNITGIAIEVLDCKSGVGDDPSASEDETPSDGVPLRAKGGDTLPLDIAGDGRTPDDQARQAASDSAATRQTMPMNAPDSGPAKAAATRTTAPMPAVGSGDSDNGSAA
jgi:PPM family protein phosphatase